MEDLAVALAFLKSLAFKRNAMQGANLGEESRGEEGVEGVAHLQGLLPGGPAFLAEDGGLACVRVMDAGVQDVLANTAEGLEGEFDEAVRRGVETFVLALGEDFVGVESGDHAFC